MNTNISFIPTSYHKGQCFGESRVTPKYALPLVWSAVSRIIHSALIDSVLLRVFLNTLLQAFPVFTLYFSCNFPARISAWLITYVPIIPHSFAELVCKNLLLTKHQCIIWDAIQVKINTGTCRILSNCDITELSRRLLKETI